MSTSAIRYSPTYTVDDYEQWEGDWELWNGVAVCRLRRRHRCTSMLG